MLFWLLQQPERRPVAAHLHREIAGIESGAHRVRRAGFRARRVDPGADHQSAPAAAEGFRTDIPVYLT